MDGQEKQKHPGGRPRRTDGARQTTIHLSAEAHALAVALAKEHTRGNLSALIEKLIRNYSASPCSKSASS